MSFVKPVAGRVKISSAATIFIRSLAGGAPSDPLSNLILTVDGTLAKGSVFGQFPRLGPIGTDMLLFYSIAFLDVRSLTAGSHTVALRWYVTATDLILTCDAAAAPTDNNASLSVEEVAG